jgi:hypothetical protein
MVFGRCSRIEAIAANCVTLIDRYFPEKLGELDALAGQKEPAAYDGELHEEAQRGRNAAFRLTILKIHRFSCAACWIRALLESQLPWWGRHAWFHLT